MAVSIVSEAAMTFLEFEAAAAGTRRIAADFVGNHPPHALVGPAAAGGRANLFRS
ncbi:MAG: hypothetical protein WCA08_01445 [Desulfoferrobacter sp.]